MEEAEEEVQEETKDAERIKELEQKLAEKKTQAKMNQPTESELPSYNYHDVTGIRSGTVRDIDVNESSYGTDSIHITVEFKDGEETVIRCSEPTSYTTDNEIVRLLEWKGIPNGEMGDLLNESVLVFTDTGSFAVPQRLDGLGKASYYAELLGRSLGFKNTRRFLNSSNFDKMLVSLFLYTIGMIIITALLIPLRAAGVIGPSVLVLSMVFLPIPVGILGMSVWNVFEAWQDTFRERREAKQQQID